MIGGSIAALASQVPLQPSLRTVNTHRFVYTTSTGCQSAEPFEFRNDDDAAVCAKALLSDEIIAIGVRRHGADGNDERVGLWLWKEARPEWKPNE